MEFVVTVLQAIVALARDITDLTKVEGEQDTGSLAPPNLVRTWISVEACRQQRLHLGVVSDA